MEINGINKKLRGYQKAPRDRFNLLQQHILTQEEFLIYELAIAITDWDDDHSTYGTFKATNKELAQILGWSSDSPVVRYKQSLIRKGYLRALSSGFIQAIDFEAWQIRKPYQKNSSSEVAKLQPLPANLQHEHAEMQTEAAKLQEFPAQKTNYSLGSFKGESMVSRSNEDYLSMWEERGRPADFGVDDMKWIDLNVTENPTIPS